MVSELLTIPGSDSWWVHYQLLPLSDVLSRVFVRRVLRFVRPTTVNWDRNCLDWPAFFSAWVSNALDCESDGLGGTRVRPILSLWILSRHDIVVVAKFDILEGKVRIVLKILVVFLDVNVPMLVDIFCQLFLDFHGVKTISLVLSIRCDGH